VPAVSVPAVSVPAVSAVSVPAVSVPDALAEHASLVPAGSVPDVSVPDAFDEDIAATSAKMCDDMNKVFEELLNLREESLETREYILDNSLAEFNGCVCSYNKHLSFQRFGDISATIILCSIVFAFWY
jgi:glutamyl-tRNA reductase